MLELLQQKLSTDGFWSISGALIGAFVGALFGILASLYLDAKRESKVKHSFYQEAEFLAGIMATSLLAVVSEYEKVKIDIGNNESFSGPLELDFGVFDALFFELYKTKNIPSSDLRRFVLNVRPQWDRVCKLDIGRVEHIEGTNLYKVSRVKSKEIVFFLVDLLYHFDLLIVEKHKFKFGNKADFKAQSTSVFSKYGIKNFELVEKITKELAHKENEYNKAFKADSQRLAT